MYRCPVGDITGMKATFKVNPEYKDVLLLKCQSEKREAKEAIPFKLFIRLLLASIEVLIGLMNDHDCSSVHNMIASQWQTPSILCKVISLPVKRISDAMSL